LRNLLLCQLVAQRSGLRLAVAHHYQGDEVRVVVDRAVRVRDAVAELTPLMNTAGRFRGSVAANATGERELLKEALHPGQILSLVRVDLGVGALGALEIRL